MFSLSSPLKAFYFYLLVVLGGRSAFEGPIEEVARAEAGEAEDLLRQLDIPVH